MSTLSPEAVRDAGQAFGVYVPSRVGKDGVLVMGCPLCSMPAAGAHPSHKQLGLRVMPDDGGLALECRRNGCDPYEILTALGLTVDQASKRPGLLDGLRTGDWLDAQTFPELRWVVPGLVPEGMTLLIGGPKIGKSWLSLDVALSTASGRPALGKVAPNGTRPVLLLALEDGDRRLQNRARHLLGDEPIPANLSYMTVIEPGKVIPTIRAWLETLDPNDDPLVILDTLGKVMPQAGPGESAYQRDYRIAGDLKRVCDDRPGMSLVVLHHDRKASSEDFVDGVSGTNGIAGAADTIIVLARQRTESNGLFKVTGRDVVESEYAVTVTDGQWRIDGDDLDAARSNASTARLAINLGDRSSEILRFVAKHPEGVRADDVANECEIPQNEARTYLGRLHETGRIFRPSRGLYTPVATVASVASLVDLESERNESNTRNTTQGAGSVACSECERAIAPGRSSAGLTTCAACEAAE